MLSSMILSWKTIQLILTEYQGIQYSWDIYRFVGRELVEWLAWDRAKGEGENERHANYSSMAKGEFLSTPLVREGELCEVSQDEILMQE